MEELLVNLTKHAEWQRLLPFPNQYRITTQPDTPHTEEEYNAFMSALAAREPQAITYATTINLDIVKHNQSSINSRVTEFEFQYHYVDNYKKNLKYPNRWYLFHGSRVSNWHSILRSGIKNMSGTRFMSTGQALGPGVYASSDLRIASSYGMSNNNKTYVAVLELLVDPAQYMKSPTIYVIPDDTILFPRYLLVINGHPNFDGQDLLAFYKKLRDGLIKPNTKIKRLALDRTSISQYFIEELSNTCWLLYINDLLFRCYIVSYPFKAPVLQICNKTDSPHFDEHGCYLSYPYSDWLLNNNIADVVEHLRNTVAFPRVKKEEYEML